MSRAARGTCAPGGGRGPCRGAGARRQDLRGSGPLRARRGEPGLGVQHWQLGERKLNLCLWMEVALGENPGEARGGQCCCCRIVCLCRTSVLLTELLCAASLLLDDAQAPEWGRSNFPGWLLSLFWGCNFWVGRRGRFAGRGGQWGWSRGVREPAVGSAAQRSPRDAASREASHEVQREKVFY